MAVAVMALPAWDRLGGGAAVSLAGAVMVTSTVAGLLDASRSSVTATRPLEGNPRRDDTRLLRIF